MIQKIYTKKRAEYIIIIILSLILLNILLDFLFFISTSYGSIHKNKYDIVYIKTGDNIWNIAEEYVGKETDIRSLIHEIYVINKIPTNKPIFPGDKILIPIKE